MGLQRLAVVLSQSIVQVTEICGQVDITGGATEYPLIRKRDLLSCTVEPSLGAVEHTIPIRSDTTNALPNRHPSRFMFKSPRRPEDKESDLQEKRTTMRSILRIIADVAVHVRRRCEVDRRSLSGPKVKQWRRLSIYRVLCRSAEFPVYHLGS